MKRKRLIGLAMVALALAGLVSLAAFRLVRSGTAATTRPPALTEVVAAAVPLTPGTALRAQDLKLLALPPGTLPQHVFGAVKPLVGRVVTAAAVANQVIVGEMVAAPGSGVGLPPLIPAGMRAVSVKVNDVVSVAGFAIPGTHVDVLLTGSPVQNGDPRTIRTITLLSNVQVLTAGQQMEQNPNGKPEAVTVITLLVDPEGAEKLALADGYGQIQLSLRNPLDHVAEATPPLLNASLYDGDAPPRHPEKAERRRSAPATPPPPPPWAVDMISGDKQQVVSFARGGAIHP